MMLVAEPNDNQVEPIAVSSSLRKPNGRPKDMASRGQYAVEHGSTIRTARIDLD